MNRSEISYLGELILKNTLEEYRKRKVVPTRLQYEDYYRSNNREKSTGFLENLNLKDKND